VNQALAIEDTFSSKMPGNPNPISGGKLRTSLRSIGDPFPTSGGYLTFS